MFFFDADITREASYPLKFMTEEVPDDTNCQNDNPCQDDAFAKLLIHCQNRWIPIKNTEFALPFADINIRGNTQRTI